MQYPLDHIVIYAADPAASGRFYAVLLGELGFEKRRDHVFARDGLFIDIRAATIDGEPYQRGRRGVDHIGFRAESAEQVRALERRLDEAGVESGRLVEFDCGDLALFVPDPDGVRIEITAYASPEAEPVD
jgi:lactoylglutathione lyase